MMVLTSSVPQHCRPALTHLGLMPYFERIVFAQELGLEKKNPDCFRRAAELAGVAAEECVMYDDSLTACRGAKAAGMQVVGVYDDYFDMTWDEMQGFCDRSIRSFEELLERERS
jgi:FMN phosphatase YigB (HAD superfamily)